MGMQRAAICLGMGCCVPYGGGVGHKRGPSPCVGVGTHTHTHTQGFGAGEKVDGGFPMSLQLSPGYVPVTPPGPLSPPQAGDMGAKR